MQKNRKWAFLGVLGIMTLQPAYAVKVGLILDRGGKDDKSFNAAAFKGATEAQTEWKIELKEVEAPDDHSFESLARSFAQKDFDLIIGIGVSQMEAIKKVATKFPDKKFAIVDAEVNLPNVRSLLFQEHEGSYLVGALAALLSKTGTLGFVGGMDIPLIRRFELGYKAGAEHFNPKIKVLSNFVGVTSEAWNNPAKAKELALSQYAAGADIVFSAAGASGMGIFDAAEAQKKFAIGVDSNQNWVRPGRILTSMLKRVDVAVKQTIGEVKDGKFKAGTARFGLGNQGIDYAVDKYNEAMVSPEVRKKLDQLKSDILSGKIKVPDYYLRK